MADDFVDADSQVTDPKHRFLFKLNEEGGKVARDNNLPVPAMLACAAAESGWGGSDIFQATGCHFNLQRPSWYTWMKCKTIKLQTYGLGNNTLVWTLLAHHDRFST
jgi:flagellum-specific peptidoglycan hydrolase FlgJ